MTTRPRTATWRQGVLLLFGSCLPILGAVLLGPVLPDVQRHFAATPYVAVMVPIMLTLPALMIGIFAPFAGLVMDRFGRRRALLVALVFYGILGTAPIWLDKLPTILLFRAGLGITEAVIMTACTTLIGDYYAGAARERWLSLQGALGSVSAMLFFGIGGALGEFGWRVPFLLYASALILLPLCLVFLWEPARPMPAPARVGSDGAGAGLPWRVLAAAYPFSVITGAALLFVPIQAGFLLNQMGVTSPGVIGLVSAANQAAVLAGALLFRPLVRLGYAGVFCAGFGLGSAGLVAVGIAAGRNGVLVGGMLSGAGSGILLVGLINWAMASLPVQVRARGTGGFLACVFFGEFISPLIVLALRHAGFSLSGAIGACGWALAGMTVLGVAAPLLSGTSRPVQAVEPAANQAA